MNSDNIEFIVTIRCKVCGEIASLSIPLSFDEARIALTDFADQHEHPNPNPWEI